MKALKLLLILSVVLSGVRVLGDTAKEPHIGYLYPSGGQQGTKIQVTVGGQILRGPKEVYVSGDGVTASVVKFQGRLKQLNQDQREELQRRLRELRQKKSPAMPGRGSGAGARPKEQAKKDPNAPAGMETKPVELPDHPLLRNLDKLSLEGLDHVSKEFIRPNLNQQNMQLAETVVIEINIAADAAPGQREVRLQCGSGLSNPMRFVVGTLPEVREPEYCDPGNPVTTKVEIPAVINGQILPGEVDRFGFHATKGQQLVIEAQARRLIPYLSDAVPGWFQATLKLYTSGGKEIAFADDFRFDPDPVMHYEIPRDGDYTLEINDAIYRGRDDFVYRISVGQQPFVTRIFPLGAKSETSVTASVAGWNVTENQLKLDASGVCGIYQTVLMQDGKPSNSILYAVDDLPECVETENNDTLPTAQKINWPMIVNGRIAKPDDIDIFQFEGRKDQDVVIEVFARRLNSPLDSLVQLTDKTGKVLSWNDDHEDKESGLMTHYADSYLSVRLPDDGVYQVRLADSQHHGGEDYGYRLHLRKPESDFSVFVSPSSLNIPAGRVVILSARVFRKEGFSGDVKLELKDAPAGFALDGAVIPAGKDTLHMTLKAPQNLPLSPLTLKLQGQAQIDGKTVTRPAVVCEDMMQAFAYRHLVASEELMVAGVGGRRAMRVVSLTDTLPLRIPAGGSTQVHVDIPPVLRQQKIQLALSDAPAGVTLEDMKINAQGLVFTLKTDEKTVEPGFLDNLIVEVTTQAVPKESDNEKAKKAQQWNHFGFLPAIPVEILKL